VLGILMFIALVGNVFPLLLWPAGELMLGGTAVLLLARLYGLRTATIAALLASLPLLAMGHFSWHHLYWIAEAIVVAMFLQRGLRSLLAADALFWIFFAGPLHLLVYGVLFKTAMPIVLGDFLLQSSNSLLNAGLAGALHWLLVRKGWNDHPTLTFLEAELNILAVCFILPALAVIALNLYGPRDIFHPAKENAWIQHCLQAEEQIHGLYGDLLQALGPLAAKTGGEAQRQAALAGRAHPALQEVFVVGDHGQVEVHARFARQERPFRLKNFLEAPGLDQLKTRRAALFGILQGSDPRENTVAYLALPRSSEEQRQGFVLAILRPVVFRNLLGDAAKTQAGLLLLDWNNNLLAAGNHSHELYVPLPSERPQGSYSSRYVPWIPGRVRLGSWWSGLWKSEHRSPNQLPGGLQLVMDAPWLAHRKNLQRLLLQGMGIMLLPGTLALAIVWRIQRKIVQPLEQLNRATENLPEKIQAGTTPTWPRAAVYETGVLIQNFGQLSSALAHSYEELARLRQHSDATIERLLVQHRWESFTSERQLEKTSRKLEQEKSASRRIRELAANIESAEAKYRLLIENTMVGVYIIRDNRYAYVNPRFAEIFGYDAEEIVDHGRFLELIHPEDRLMVGANHLKQFNDKSDSHQRFEYRGIRKTGEIIYVEVLTGLGSNEGRPALIGTLLDITERRQAEQTIRHMAFHDPLTGLPNRLLFLDRVNQALARAERNREILALLFIDLDRFKSVNDSLGHTIGDLLLREAAQRLAGSLRETDTVSRFGGDEFNLLLTQVHNVEETAVVANKILQSMERPYLLDGHELFLTCSIGIAMFPKDGQDAHALIKNADVALYRAKDLGRKNFQFYSADMNARALERIAMESSLRRVFERQELRVHYQPQIDLATGRITGLEGLLRWQQPSGEMISPSVFIPLAEETGMIVPIGEWVLRAGCYQLRAWQDNGLSALRLGINVSGHQFQKNDFCQVVIQVLKESSLPASCLNLEITESVIMHDVKEAIETLEHLHEVGVTIAIDDFGTGFSSLSYLKDFPVDHLKIDRAFVKNLPHSTNDANIARHIIELAHGLNLKVIAEGVENDAQLRFLQQAGCDEIQGYLVSHPLPAEDIAELLQMAYPFPHLRQFCEAPLPSEHPA
jgi:diguanylate cyclase (GGDEF)-like protein/PAS domain S-box-containing protein